MIKTLSHLGSHTLVNMQLSSAMPRRLSKKPDADEIPYVTGDPDTKDKFLAERNNTWVVEALGQKFLFSTNGEFWCHGKVDDVVDTNLPLALIYGLYKLGSQAEAEISSGRGWKFELKSATDRVQCSSEVNKGCMP